MIVIAGLGNPGTKYEKTRHNVGFDVIDELARRYNIEIRDKKFQALTGTGVIEGQKVLLVKPQTFMNLSGNSVSEAVNFYKLDPSEELIVVSDDISLEPGRIRIRKKGSAGGHNGLKHIIACCGTDQFERVKIGVGEKPEGWDLADHVLGHFPKDERAAVDDAYKDAVEAIKLMVMGETDQAMNVYNAKKQ